MNAHTRKAFWLGLAGLVLILLGIKYSLAFLDASGAPPEQDGQAHVLFFSVDEPCECMLDLTRRAEYQMAIWADTREAIIPVRRIAMEQRKDLEMKYQIFRAPCLMLVDAQGQVAWRQDYPMIEGEPFKLEELETAIAVLGTK